MKPRQFYERTLPCGCVDIIYADGPMDRAHDWGPCPEAHDWDPCPALTAESTGRLN